MVTCVSNCVLFIVWCVLKIGPAAPTLPVILSSHVAGYICGPVVGGLALVHAIHHDAISALFSGLCCPGKEYMFLIVHHASHTANLGAFQLVH